MTTLDAKCLQTRLKYIHPMTINVSFSSSVENELRELIKDSKLIGEIDLRLTGQNFLNARGEIDRIARKYGKGYINHIGLSKTSFLQVR